MAANVITRWYATEAQAGDDLNNTQTISVTTNPETPGPWQAPGNIVEGNSSSTWMFVKASTTVTSGNVIMIDANYNANNLTSTIAASMVSFTVGIAQFNGEFLQTSASQRNAQPGDYFWSALSAQGGLQVNTVSTASRATQLYLAIGTPGSLTASTGSSAIFGIFANTSFANSGSNTVTDYLINGPLRTSA